MIAKRPSRARTNRTRFEAPPAPPTDDIQVPTMPEPPTPPPPAPAPISPAPTVASGKVKLPSYPLVVVAIMFVAASALGLAQLAKKGLSTSAATTKSATKTTVTAFNPDDVAQLVAHVAKHISVDTNVAPSVATVQDAEMLRSQNLTFYKEVEVGDRLLLWPDKAVLFSVKRDVVLNAMAIPVAAANNAPSNDEKETAMIEVRNGSGVAGLGRTVAKQLSAAGVTTLPATDANEKNYEKTIIAVPEGKSYPTTVQTLQRVLGVSTVTTIPTAETGVKGDVLVVVGLDQRP